MRKVHKKLRVRYFWGLLFVATYVITTAVTPFLSSTTASALMVGTAGDVEARVQKKLYLLAFIGCVVQGSMPGEVAETDINSGKWLENYLIFGQTYAISGYPNSNTSGQLCTDTSFILNAIKIAGWANPIEAACAMGMPRKGGGDCANSVTPFVGQPSAANALSAVNTKVGSDITSLSGEEIYFMYASAMEKGCAGKLVEVPPSGDNMWTVKIVDASGNVSDQTFSSVHKKSDQIPIWSTTRFQAMDVNLIIGYNGGLTFGEFLHVDFTSRVMGFESATCETAASVMADRATDYSNYIKSDPSSTTPSPTDPGGGTEETTTCTVQGIGWIVCPVMSFMAGVNDVLYGALQTMLKVNPMIFTGDTNSDSNSDLYGAWNTFRGIANILFIVVFLIIIYSQITSVGITNYGLKKLLPKLIIAAVLVNVSFYICQIAVDVANILGYGLKSLFTSIGAGIGSQASTSTWENALSGVGGALVATTAAGASVALIMAISVPTLLAGLLALLMVVIILIVRQAIIILLIAVSPLAFVAWLLPNTEKWFKKWWELFFSMLMLFPIISALFGAGALASRILGTSNFGDDGGIAKFAALGAAVLPLVATIPLLQGALKATGALGAKMNGWSGKANARLGSKVKSESMIGKAWSGGMANRASKRTSFQNKALSKGPMRYVAGALGGKGYSATLADRATAIEDKEHHEAVERATTGLVGKSDNDILAQAQDSKRSAADRQAAISHLLQKGDFGQKQKALEAASSLDDTRARTAIADEYAKSDMSSLYGKGLAATIRAPQKDKNGVSKPPLDLAGTLRGNYGNVSAQTLAGSKDYARAVKESAKTATDEQKEHLMNVLNQIENNPNINPTSETQGHLDELTDTLTRPPTAPGTPPPATGTP